MQLSILILPLAVSAATLQARQRAGSGTPAPVASIEELKPVQRASARRTLTRFGPYTIKANTAAAGGKNGGGKAMGGMGDSTLGGQAFWLSIREGLCNDPKLANGPCSVLGGRVGVQWVDGREASPANGIYIHHILSSDNTKKENPWISNCNTPTRAPMNVAATTGGSGFLSTGEDGSAERIQYGATDKNFAQIGEGGYHVGAQDRFTAWAQLVNYNKEPAKVYITFDVEWFPGNKGDNIQAVTLSATCGAGRIKMSEAGPANTTSGKFYIMEDGKILGGRGHLHDGGSVVRMFQNNKLICGSEAVYGTKDTSSGAGGMGGHSHGGDAAAMPSNNEPAQFDIKTISSMTECTGPYPVKKGDTIVLEAEYDLKAHPLRKSAGGQKAADVMGMMGMHFAAGRVSKL